MNKEPLTLRYIFTLILKDKKALIYGQLLTVLAIIISVPIPLMLPVLVDEVLLDKPAFFVNSIDSFFSGATPFVYITFVTFLVIFLRFVYYIFSVLTTKIFTKISKYVTFKIRERLLEHLKIASMNEYETLGSGAITSNLVTDVNTLDSFIMNTSSKLVSSTLMLLAVGGVMIAIDPIMGFLILIIQPIIMLLSKKMSKKVGLLKRDENASIERFQENIGETLELYGQIKASNKENYFFSEAISRAKDVQKSSNEYGFKNIAYERLSYTIFLVMYEVLRASGLLLVAYSDLSIGMMFAMFGYIWFIMTPVQDILGMQYSYSSAMAALERLNKILTLKTEKSSDKKLKDGGVDIVLKNLNFSYTPQKPTLKNISMKIKHKDKVALIGASGSGKTTLAQIIAGFYERDDGGLFYNDIPIDELDKHSLRSKVFLVLQMPILFNATLRFNLTMGDDSISDEEIKKALHTAQLTKMLEGMSDGLNTIVGRHGIRLSGGQRQRMSIARMIIANPDVVIFDESTSALDVHTELKLYTALEPILESKTVITIAHRLSTVKGADMIYVLDEGKIVQAGTHDKLEDEEGHYMEFIKKQLI